LKNSISKNMYQYESKNANKWMNVNSSIFVPWIHTWEVRNKLITPLIFILDTRVSWAFTFTLWELYPKEITPDSHWIGDCMGPKTLWMFWGTEKNLVPSSIKLTKIPYSLTQAFWMNKHSYSTTFHCHTGTNTVIL
jgi:hypothetical protein